MSLFSLVIVTHQSARWMPGFGRSWRDSLAACVPGQISRIAEIIADAGSTDDTVSETVKHFPRARIMPLANRGFGASANAAIREVQTPWVLLCNADLSLPREFAANLLAACEAAPPDAACIVPRLLNGDGTVQYSVGRFPTLGSIVGDQFRRQMQRKYISPQPAAAGVVDWASGACMILRREAFQAVGGFDEKYFLYVEELDLQRRLADAGGKIYFDPALQVTHFQPNASRIPRREVRRYAARGMLRYFAKFGGGLAGFRVLGLLSGRLAWGEAMASRRRILERATG